MTTYAHELSQRIMWTAVAPQRCDGCRRHVECVILHVGKMGERPFCPLAALCRTCIVAALSAAAEGSFS
jgi:hypothetical protein